ncbi:hypothetical protein QBC42DRAFT_175325 [Cladorrhinum samala]|uniref:Protein N-terminal and lysine N-methyltransferase EFM7 n=1 Tax=Cladorrhinum samala TaxID=585594 RepID=A0AAV9HRR7_9PEZI|nr:hypothetical protein QBC42DRAFT_175325 [Cladorrhinum samala]
MWVSSTESRKSRDRSRSRSRSRSAGRHRRRNSRSRSRSPRRRDGLRDEDRDRRRRSRSHSRYRDRRRDGDHHHHHHHHHHQLEEADRRRRSRSRSRRRDQGKGHRHHRDREGKEQEGTLGPLPFDARKLSKSDLPTFKPIFAYYLDLQKQLDIRSLSESERRGRWKSFVSKWNKGELSEGWYDPELFRWVVNEYRGSPEPEPSSLASPPPPHLPVAAAVVTNATDDNGAIANSNDPQPRKGHPGSGSDSNSDSDSDSDDFGPPPPPGPHSSTSHNPHRPHPPTESDLSDRRDLLASEKFQALNLERHSRKEFRNTHNATLDELVPKSDPGSRERKLEKRKAVTEKLKGFGQEKDAGVEDVREEDLMGGGDEAEEYRKLQEKETKKKNERRSRRDEEDMLRRMKREERLKEYREREERTMEGLRALAKERFGTGGLDLFRDPENYYPPTPPPTTQKHRTLSGEEITLHLVGHSPLEAHHLWNGARVVSDHFESSPSATVSGRTVLELGAGAGLPSIMAAVLGARKVVVTDFPDPDLVENMWKNIRGCHLLFPSLIVDNNNDNNNLDEKLKGGEKGESSIVADGFVWGANPAHLLAHLPREERSRGFDVLILADLLFRHSEHGNMLKTVRETLKKNKDAKAYVVFCSYRPWLRHKDLNFFELAREQGFVVEQILERKMERPLFENDPGDEEVLKTVTGWVVRWPEEVCVE